MRTSLRKHIIYWILPSAISIACIFIYFFDFFGLSYLIANPINREFGIVENLQLVLLMLIFFVATKGIKNNTNKRARQCFRFLAAACILLFLEEIDYGLHYRDYFTSYDSGAVMMIDYNTEIRNLHNNGKITNVSKMISYATIVGLFVVIPLIPSTTREKYPFYKHLSPSRLIVMTAVCLLIVNNLALYFYRYTEHPNSALNGNISEFEEIMTYYIFLLYIAELAYSHKLSLLFDHYGAGKRRKVAAPVYDQPDAGMQKVF